MRSVVGVIAAGLFALSGCSSAGPQSPVGPMPETAQSTSSLAASDGAGPDLCAKAKIYVADYAKSDVEVYSQGVANPSPCAKIVTGISCPEALYADAKGTLYVGNYCTSSVTEYLPGAKKPHVTLTTTAPPYDVFVGKGGVLYVAEASAGQVEEYLPGATVPVRTVPLNGGPHGVATDSSNNLYVSYLSNADGVSHVEKFAPAATVGTDLGFTVSFAGEVKLDKSNDVVIGDRNNNDVVYIYPPGQIIPSRSIRTPGGNPVNFALNHAETTFYVSGFLAVSVLDYNTGAAITNIFTGLTSPSGVAAYPPAPY